MLGFVALHTSFAALGFGALFAVSAAMVYWRDRHVRRDRAYWNGHT